MSLHIDSWLVNKKNIAKHWYYKPALVMAMHINQLHPVATKKTDTVHYLFFSNNPNQLPASISQAIPR